MTKSKKQKASRFDAALAKLGLTRSKNRKGKIRVPLNKTGRKNVKQKTREIMKEVRLRPAASRAMRAGKNPFGGIQSAGMPGNEDVDP